jgi:nucleoside-diphosphate-sugar epimerase
MSKVLITGGNGFIGRKLCSKLSFSGRKIKKIVRKIKENDSSEQCICEFGVDQVSEDVFDDVDTVFHLVGVTHDINNSMTDSLYYDVNVTATEQLAKTAAKKGVKRFIYISSVKAGGSPTFGECMTEEDQAEPDGIYGKTKREAEIRLLEIGNKSEIDISIIRPALVYGPGVKGNLRKMLLSIKKGWFPPLPEIGNRRSMIHVDDLVDLLLLVERDKRSNGEIFIATDGNNYSSNQIYRAMSKSVDKNIKNWVVPNLVFISLAKIGDLVNIVLPFPFDSYRYQKLLGDECFSSKKIQTILGFKASRTIFSNSKSNHER